MLSHGTATACGKLSASGSPADVAVDGEVVGQTLLVGAVGVHEEEVRAILPVAGEDDFAIVRRPGRASVRTIAGRELFRLPCFDVGHGDGELLLRPDHVGDSGAVVGPGRLGAACGGERDET